MTVVVSTLYLSQFMNCPVVGAHAQGPLPTKIDAPINTIAPTITGSLTTGSTLTATTGTWTGADPITYTYQWNRDGVPIIGATSKTYVIQGADTGHTLSVTVTATNHGGPTSATSTSTLPIGGLLNSHLPIITGTLIVGNTLTTDDGGWVGAPPPTFAYSWQRDGVDVPGATTNTYLLTHADTGHNITSRVIATNIAGSVSAYSGAYGPVQEHLSYSTPPTISGSQTVGSVLTVDAGVWNGTIPITFTYQWMSNGVAVANQTTTSYVLTSADLGNTITCVVTASNSLDTIPVTTNAIGPIIPPATLALSSTVVAKSAAVGATVGTISVVGSISGTYTYTLTSNPSGMFAISGANLTVATGLSVGGYPVTVQAAGGVPSPVVQNFTITVAAINLSASTIAGDANVGDVVGTFSVTNGTGTYTYAMTDPSNQFALSGADLTVSAALSPGNYPVSVTATGGVPTPISDSFLITVTSVIITHTEGAWYGGLPYPGIAIATSKAGTSRYWYGGLIDPVLKD